MPLMLVRHAHALSRGDWEGDDAQRELSKRGRKQSQLLAARLLELEPVRILSSPYVRCLDTVGPLARALGVRVEVEDRLAEGSGQPAVELVRSLSDEDVVLCSHGDVIPDVLAAVAHEDRVDLGPAPRVEKASVWLLYGEGGRFHSASYLTPPKTD